MDKMRNDNSNNKTLYIWGRKANKYLSVSSCIIDLYADLLYFLEIRICTWFENSFK